MTKKEYLDLLVASCHDGTFPSANGINRTCYYRLDETPGCRQRCGVGLLIPDGTYYPELEGFTPADESLHCVIELPKGMTLVDLCDVQRVHDMYASRSEWPSAKAAAEFGGLNCFKEFKS